MPRRPDLRSVMVIGSGPIVIGQACEFDYSGTQAVRVLREEGLRVVLVNSNPATIMTDPDLADATYVEPITPEVVASIIRRERPDALLATLGGQTALNTAAALHGSGTLDELGVELIGASMDAIEAAENRQRFKEVMEAAGIAVAGSAYCRSIAEAVEAAAEIGYPVIVRPSYIMGGGGTGTASGEVELRQVVADGMAASPIGEVLVEESLVGWKEFELEVMRDGADNAVIVCGIENLDPMGVHTGDSITVAPIQTLSDREYQAMRDEAIACLRAIGVETGGSNVQFAVDPDTGRRVVIEMNPRVSRSSALASKATGFPIAKIAAKLAIGYTLDEIANDITAATPASFEPVLDYVVVKVPRFDFAKFPATSDRLGTAMQSVGEAMAIGRTFPEALQKAVRSLENGAVGLGGGRAEEGLRAVSEETLKEAVATPTPERLDSVAEALRRGISVDDVARISMIDPWFVDGIARIVEMRRELEKADVLDPALMRRAKRLGYSDEQIGRVRGESSAAITAMRESMGLHVTYKTVDTCAAEFVATTPYLYGTWEDTSEAPGAEPGTVMVLGSGPNRIGQGIEFDYCCVHAAMAIRDSGRRVVMVNCNPETVSTDYDTSDRLYFEPLTAEDVLAVAAVEKPEAVIVQLGGQTPLGLTEALANAGYTIAGTQPDAIDIAEDRQRFSALCRELDILQPPHGIATSLAEAEAVVDRIGLPVLVRPSYVLGGRAMRVVYSLDELATHLRSLYAAPAGGEVDASGGPILIDRFLEAAAEVDVDAVYDGTELHVGGIMEHVEEAGVHSGDSACVVPAQHLSDTAKKTIMAHTEALADGLGVRGLVNIQFAVRGDEVYVLEVNPRASRTVPFISKATGIPLAKVATRVMLGDTIAELRAEGMIPDGPGAPFVAVKHAVLPWNRFRDEDVLLGPEMRATGEVMGIGEDLSTAYAKALLGAGIRVPSTGTVFFSVADRDKDRGMAAAQAFHDAGFRLIATQGTAAHLAREGIAATHVDKVGEGPWDPVRLIEEGKIELVINTPRGRRARGDGAKIRRAANRRDIPCITTIQGALAVARGVAARVAPDSSVASLQELHAWI